MKSLILIAVLAALTVCNDAASSQNEGILYQAEDASLYQKDGKFNIDTYFTEIFRNYYRRTAVDDTVQYLNIIYTGNYTTRVTSIALVPQPPFEGAFAEILSGLGSNNVTARINSTVGGGFHYLLQVWGYDTEW